MKRKRVALNTNKHCHFTLPHQLPAYYVEDYNSINVNKLTW